MLKMLSLFMLAAVLIARQGIAEESAKNCPSRKELHRAMQEYEDAFNPIYHWPQCQGNPPECHTGIDALYHPHHTDCCTGNGP